MTPTDRVRAALKYAKDHLPAHHMHHGLDYAISLLDGHVLVPIEPTFDQLMEANDAVRKSKAEIKDVFAISYRAMIAPYVRRGE